MKTSILLSLFLVACGGPTFQSEDSTESDAGSDSNPTSLDALGSPLDSTGADREVGFEADAASDSNDSWPDDVVLEPYCPESEFYPTFSNTCYTWGANHGWSLQGCCLSDHTCGTIYLNRCNR